jgi:hypothetical protein
MTEPDRGATKGRTPAADSRDSANDSPAPDRNSHRLPAVSLPKGGGAIHGMGEKFGTNPATGTGSMSIPLPSSPARGEFGPKLSLNYDSASGNGPFGFGWSLGLSAVTRKTDKGLPRYRDALTVAGDDDQSDVFLLSGAEDLVPVLDDTGNRISFRRTLHTVDYRVYIYRLASRACTT